MPQVQSQWDIVETRPIGRTATNPWDVVEVKPIQPPTAKPSIRPPLLPRSSFDKLLEEAKEEKLREQIHTEPGRFAGPSDFPAQRPQYVGPLVEGGPRTEVKPTPVPTVTELAGTPLIPIGGAVRKLRERAPAGEMLDPKYAAIRGFLETLSSAGQVSADVIEGLSTPANLALLGGLIAAPAIGIPKLAVQLGGGVFSVAMAKNAGQRLSKAYDLYQKGDIVGAGEEVAGAGVDSIFALLTGKPLAKTALRAPAAGPRGGVVPPLVRPQPEAARPAVPVTERPVIPVQKTVQPPSAVRPQVVREPTKPVEPQARGAAIPESQLYVRGISTFPSGKMKATGGLGESLYTTIATLRGGEIPVPLKYSSGKHGELLVFRSTEPNPLGSDIFMKAGDEIILRVPYGDLPKKYSDIADFIEKGIEKSGVSTAHPEIPPVERPVAPTPEAAVPQAREGAVAPQEPTAPEGTVGTATTLRTTAGDQPAVYRVVEADSLEPSHNPMTFTKNPVYPEGVQPRQYQTNKNAQMDVINIAKKPNFAQLVNTDPTAIGGPPQVTPEGIVIGGNTRTMALQRIYRSSQGKDYKAFLEGNAEQFGIDPAAVRAMKKPMLVREIPDAPTEPAALARLAQDLNQPFTKPLAEVEAAVSAGQRLTPESVNAIVGELTKGEEAGTLRDAMASNPILFRDVLLRDGVFQERDLPRYFTSEGAINAVGKEFIENALLGKIVPDADLLQGLPKSISNKLERAIPPLIELGSRADNWNIVPEVVEAAQMAARAQAKGWSIEKYIRQGDIFERPNERIQAIAELFTKTSTKVADAFKRFANEARAAEGRELFEGTFDPVEAFGRIIQGVRVGGENTIFTRKVMEESQGRLEEYFGGETLRTGIDPTILPDLVKVGGFWLEAGLREFPAWSAKMIENFGERIRPYLQSVWDQSLGAAKRGSKTAPERMGFVNTEIVNKLARVEEQLSNLTPEAQIIRERAAETFERGTVPREVREEFYGPKRPAYEETYELKVSVADIDRARNALQDSVKTTENWLQQVDQMGDESGMAVGKVAVDYLNQATRLFRESGTTAGRILQSLQRPSGTKAGFPRGGLAEQPVEQLAKTFQETVSQAKKKVAAARELLRGVRILKERTPLTTSLLRGARDWSKLTHEERMGKVRDLVDHIRLNYFSVTSWSLDFISNLAETTRQVAGGIGYDLVYVTKSGETTFPSLQGFLHAIKERWTKRFQPMEEGQFRLEAATRQGFEEAFGKTVGGERIAGAFRGGPGAFTYRQGVGPEGSLLRKATKIGSTIFDYMVGGPMYAKGAMDTTAKRLMSTAYIWREAIKAADAKGLRGSRRNDFYKEFTQNLPEKVQADAIEMGNKAGFNRQLSKLEERVARSTTAKFLVGLYNRWPFQFSRWAAEMLGYNPKLFRQIREGTAATEDIGGYLTATATGWGGLYLINQLYDNVDFNSMEYVNEEGDRIRLSGREPVPTALFILALLHGDGVKAAAALRYISLPGAQLLVGEGGLLGGMIKSMQRAVENPQNRPRQLEREIINQANRMIPGQAVLGAIESIVDPEYREGFGAGIPGVSKFAPTAISATTGEPLKPRQQLFGIELPTVQGTPIPGATRLLDPTDKLLKRFGFTIYRGPRQPIAGYPPTEIPDELRREWEVEFGKARQFFMRRYIPWATKKEITEKDYVRIKKRISAQDTKAAKRATAILERRYGKQPPKERRPGRRELAGPESQRPIQQSEWEAVSETPMQQ